MALFVTGDTHGPEKFGPLSVDGYMNRLKTSAFHEQKDLTKEDYLVILGDFGGIWDLNRTAFAESRREKAGLDWLQERSFTTLFIPGNHENYDRLTGCRDEGLLNSWLYERMPEAEKEKLRKGYPRELWHGGLVRKIRPSVLMLEYGQLFDLDGKKCLALGGARSHDISEGILDPVSFKDEKSFKRALKSWREQKTYFRVRGISWWEQEVPDSELLNRGRLCAKESRYQADYIFSHEAPASCLAAFAPSHKPDSFSCALEEIRQEMAYQHWFFAHYHANASMPGGKEHLLYGQILRIG